MKIYRGARCELRLFEQVDCTKMWLSMPPVEQWTVEFFHSTYRNVIELLYIANTSDLQKEESLLLPEAKLGHYIGYKIKCHCLSEFPCTPFEKRWLAGIIKDRFSITISLYRKTIRLDLFFFSPSRFCWF